MFFIFLIEKLRNIDFGDFIFLLFHEYIFNKIGRVSLKPIEFVFLFLLCLKYVFVGLKNVFKRQLFRLAVNVEFDLIFNLVDIMERLFEWI